MTDPIALRFLGPDDRDILLGAPVGTFDNPVDATQTNAFLKAPDHDMVVALDGVQVVGFATGLVMLHPDKQPLYFINEVGVNDPYLRRGIGTRLTAALLERARERGCKGVWLATVDNNAPARGLYRSLEARETGGIVVYDWDGAMDET